MLPALAVLAAIAGCGGGGSRAASDSTAAAPAGARIDSAPQPRSAVATAAKAEAQNAAERAAGDTTTRRSALDTGGARRGGDSLRRALDTLVRLIPGRTAHDSQSFAAEIRAGLKDTRWPVKGPAPLPGALLPGKRIVAYYGNPLSKKMGILGEIPPDQMLARLDQTVADWRRADPTTPVQPALHLIAVVAQGAPGRDGMYRLRMDTSLIEKVYGWAKSKGAMLFLDIQVGKSTVQAEIPRLMPFLSRPDVHLALDPEFSMHYDKEGLPPGKKIGTMDARDVNYAIQVLADLVSAKKLPPKVLVVHRFTRRMLVNASQIRLDPRVQVVIDMDGWGPPWLKFDSYNDYERSEPVQFTGFKLFYHNDTKKGDKLLTAAEVLRLRPKPNYIQYQ